MKWGMEDHDPESNPNQNVEKHKSEVPSIKKLESSQNQPKFVFGFLVWIFAKKLYN
jgi:hypothetical protein